MIPILLPLTRSIGGKVARIGTQQDNRANHHELKQEVDKGKKVAEKVKKYIRDGNDLPEEYDLYVKNLTKELGDVLWYISAIASDLDINLETVAQMNVAKLNSRKNRNEIGGSGDNR